MLTCKNKVEASPKVLKEGKGILKEPSGKFKFIQHERSPTNKYWVKSKHFCS
jgi:hypothetical protein